MPPRYDLVPNVYAWVFHRDELVLARDAHGNWALPGADRRSGETFYEALTRGLKEQAGATLSQARLIGAIETVNQGGDEVDQPWANRMRYTPCFIAEVETLAPGNAEDRLLIEPGLARAYIPGWSALMDEMLAYALAVRSPSSVEEASRTAA